jgi:hypothetical protein
MSPYILRRTKETRDEEQQAVPPTIRERKGPDEASSCTGAPETSQTRASAIRQPTKSHYSPPLATAIGSLAIMALAAGLFSRFEVFTSESTVLGLLSLFGAAVGVDISRSVQPGMALIEVMRDINPALRLDSRAHSFEHDNLAILAEMIGGSMGIAAAQAVFISQLSIQIPRSGSDLSVIWAGGITGFRENLSGETLDRALVIFNTAITRTFYLATAAGALPVALPLIIGIIILVLILTPPGWALFVWYLIRKGKKKHQHITVQPQSYPMQPPHATGAPKQNGPTFDTQTAISSSLQGTVVSDRSHYSSTQQSPGNSTPIPGDPKVHIAGQQTAQQRYSDWFPDWMPRAPAEIHELPNADPSKLSKGL